MISFSLIKKNPLLGKYLPSMLQPIKLESFLEENKLLIERLEMAYSDQKFCLASNNCLS